MVNENSREVQTKFMTIDDIYNMLVEHEDITITVPVSMITAIRKGITKRKYRDKTAMGEFADQNNKFECRELTQTPDEEKKKVQRIRLYLIQKLQIAVEGVQINDEDF